MGPDTASMHPSSRPSWPATFGPQVLYKMSKVLGQRGLEKCAENCDVVRAEVEAFKTFVPLVQVSGLGWRVLRKP